MGVQFMQSNSSYSQLMQVGNLLHIGQHEACHNWKHGGGRGSHGYFKHLLEAEEPSISSHQYVSAEDTKPLIMRSLEINASLGGAPGPFNPPPPFTHIDSPPPPLKMLAASDQDPLPSPILSKDLPSSPSCFDSKPSLQSPSCASSLKRARDSSTHIEGLEGPCKREKKTAEETDQKGKKGGQQDGASASGRKTSCSKTKTPKPVPVEAPKTDYVHVRARRGQATDSHSLAERVRREKISERMRFLQDLVPGCSKITGKALILDEIINYVQSLQNQVEFLAMRLAAIHPNHLSLNNFLDEEIASPYVEEAKEHIDILPKAIATPAPTNDLHFESLPQFYSGFFDDANFNTSIVSDLSTSTGNDSNLTNMDFSHLS